MQKGVFTCSGQRWRGKKSGNWFWHAKYINNETLLGTLRFVSLTTRMEHMPCFNAQHRNGQSRTSLDGENFFKPAKMSKCGRQCICLLYTKRTFSTRRCDGGNNSILTHLDISAAQKKYQTSRLLFVHIEMDLEEKLFQGVEALIY